MILRLSLKRRGFESKTLAAEQMAGVGVTRVTAVPGFVRPAESRLRSFAEAVGVLFARDTGCWRYYPETFPFASAVIPGGRRSTRAIAYSWILHISACVLLTQLPVLVDTCNNNRLFRGALAKQRVYHVKQLVLSESLPPLLFSGDGGHPGRGADPRRRPSNGSTVVRPGPTIVSDALRPDNERQTIIQAAAPPELRIRYEIRVPNIVLRGNRAAVEFGGLMQARAERPSPPKAPPPPQPLEPPPQLVNLPVQNPLDRLPPPELAVGPAPAATKATAEGITNAPQSGTPGDTVDLIAVGVDAVPLNGEISLPNGNRYGAFSISAGPGTPGSPGGQSAQAAGGGTGGPGAGGDGSLAVGSGKGFPGGGGATRGGGGSVAISGTPGGTDGAPHLSAAIIASMVYPVVSLPNIRTSNMVVVAGPSGGGGLPAYGVLQGGRIYTVYLAMPGKSWVLQYSVRTRVKAGPSLGAVRSTSVQLSTNVLSPQAKERFDFKRDIPAGKRNQLIVLHGVIQEDGSVSELSVLRGVDNVADQAAVAAFERWKFQPALQAGKPVCVEVLVGIPAAPPAT